MAEAVTSTGQIYIKKAKEILDALLFKLSNNTDSVLYADTDSVVGDTLIYVNDSIIKISEFYDLISTNFINQDSTNKNFVKPVDNFTTKSFNTRTEKIETSPIKYVMKHKVKKRLFKISVGGSSVIVTEDHSVIVKRDDKYISVSPKNMRKTDILVNITTPNGVSLYETKNDN